MVGIHGHCRDKRSTRNRRSLPVRTSRAQHMWRTRPLPWLLTTTTSCGLSTSAQSSLQVFSRRIKEIQRTRAALERSGENSRTVDYVRDTVAESLFDRLCVRLSHRLHCKPPTPNRTSNADSALCSTSERGLATSQNYSTGERQTKLLCSTRAVSFQI